MSNRMALLWAQKIAEGKKTYGDVPRQLKEAVREVLENAGHEELAEESEGIE